MLLNGFRCDGCGREHLIDAKHSMPSYLDVLPASWYAVSQTAISGQQRSEPWVFCSIACLRVHPLQRHKEEERCPSRPA